MEGFGNAVRGFIGGDQIPTPAEYAAKQRAMADKRLEARPQLGVEAACGELGGSVTRLAAVLDEFEQLLAPITADAAPVPTGTEATRREIQHSELVGNLREHTVRIDSLAERIRDIARRLTA